MKHLLITLLILPIIVFSQSTTEESYSFWNSIVVNYSIKNNISLKNEVHLRRTNFLKNWQQIIIRPSINYKLNENIDLSTGYSYAKNYRDAYDFNENNIWEQFMLSHVSGKSKFKHRFRFEQRFIDNIVENTNSTFSKKGSDFTMRFRYRFTWEIPLFKIEENKNINIVAFDEIWLNTETGIVPKSLNQNWFYVGLSYPILKNTTLGIGYQNDYAPAGSVNYRSNNILQTTLKYHIK